MANPRREKPCEECGARIDSEGYCTRGCDDTYTSEEVLEMWDDYNGET